MKEFHWVSRVLRGFNGGEVEDAVVGPGVEDAGGGRCRQPQDNLARTRKRRSERTCFQLIMKASVTAAPVLRISVLL